MLVPVLLLVLFASLYYYFTRKFNHWKDKNVDYIQPIPFFGNAFPVFAFRKSVWQLFHELYTRTAQPFLGFFICEEPLLLIRDPDLIKSILIKDFEVFNDRHITENKDCDPLGSHVLLLLRNPDWKEMRRKISPAFTSGKLKLMYSLIRESGEDLIEYIEGKILTEAKINVRDLCSRYSTDVITSTSFGVNANCFKDENAEFKKANRVFDWTHLERVFSTTCYIIFPTLVKLFRLKFIDSDTGNFLRNAFWRIIRERESTGIVRNDVIDILVDIRKEEHIDDPYKLEGDKLVAQAAQFFLAGYETTSTTATFALYELALHPDLQEKVRSDILRVKSKYQSFTYEALQEMNYLDSCVKETLRKYPPLPFLARTCGSDYQIPGTDVILEKGVGLYISILGLHYDPQYFPEPDKFDPDRFLEENVANRPFGTYIPFGEGPRNCIGARLGSLNSKSALAHILSKFKVEVCEKTQIPVEFASRGFLIAPRGNKLILKFSKCT